MSLTGRLKGLKQFLLADYRVWVSFDSERGVFHFCHRVLGYDGQPRAEERCDHPVAVERTRLLKLGHGVARGQTLHQPGVIRAHPDLLQKVDVELSGLDHPADGADPLCAESRTHSWNIPGDPPDVQAQDPTVDISGLVINL